MVVTVVHPRISAKGLAEFSVGTVSRQRTIASNYKFPSQGEGIGRAIYYAGALSAIRSYHRNQNDPGILADAIRALELKARELYSKKDRLKRLRAENNIRAIQLYARQFGARKFKLLPSPRLSYRHGNVTVTASPDLCVENGGTKFLIKLDLGKKKANSEMIHLLLYIFFEAAQNAKFNILPENVLYLDATTAVEYRCPKDSRSLRMRLQSVCDLYDAVWSALPS